MSANATASPYQQRTKQGQAIVLRSSPSTCDTTILLSHGLAVNCRDTAPQKEKVCCISWGIGLENLFWLFLKRSQSQSSVVDGPPSTRRRSRSPSDAAHDVESRSTKDTRKDQHLESRVAAIEISKPDSNQKTTEQLRETAQRAEFAKLLNTRSGGMYIPPARLRAMQEAASLDKSSPEYQRLSWDALRKSITSIVNRVNITNTKQMVPELFSENLIRGRGLFARSIMKAQAASLPFTPVFAALVAIINTKLPQVGELVLTRIISQFRKSFKRNNKVGVFFGDIFIFCSLLKHFFVIRSSVIPRPPFSPILSTNLSRMKSLRSKSSSSSLNDQQTIPLKSLAKLELFSPKTHQKLTRQSLSGSALFWMREKSVNEYPKVWIWWRKMSRLRIKLRWTKNWMFRIV